MLNTLRFYADKAKDEHGWFYHFINVVTGERNGTSEVSVSDSTWLYAGALTAKQYFHEDAEIGRLADKIYKRVDYEWIRNGDPYQNPEIQRDGSCRLGESEEVTSRRSFLVGAVGDARHRTVCASSTTQRGRRCDAR